MSNNRNKIKGKAPELNTGNVVYFKEVKTSTKPGVLGVRFAGHGFGVLLGHVPPNGYDVQMIDVTRLLGSIGFVSLDDVQEILGKEQCATLLAKYELKYAYTPEEQENIKKQIEAQAKKQAEKGPELLNAQGKPVSAPQDAKIVSLHGESLEDMKAAKQAEQEPPSVS